MTQATPSPLTEGETEAWRRQRICSGPHRVRDGMRVEAASWLEARGLLLHPSLSQTSQDTGAPSIRSNEQLSDVIMPLLSRRAREKGHPWPSCVCREGWLEQEQGPGPCGQESPLRTRTASVPQTRKGGGGPRGKRPEWGARGSLGGSAPPALHRPAELLGTCSQESALESEEWVSPNPLTAPSLGP